MLIVFRESQDVFLFLWGDLQSWFVADRDIPIHVISVYVQQVSHACCTEAPTDFECNIWSKQIYAQLITQLTLCDRPRDGDAIVDNCLHVKATRLDFLLDL